MRYTHTGRNDMKQPHTKPTWAEIRGLSMVMFHTAGVTDERARAAVLQTKLKALAIVEAYREARQLTPS